MATTKKGPKINITYPGIPEGPITPEELRHIKDNNPNYGHLSSKEIQEMANEGVSHEVGVPAEEETEVVITTPSASPATTPAPPAEPVVKAESNK